MIDTKLQEGAFDRGSDQASGRYLVGRTKAVDRDARTIEAIASTIALDRDNEIILPSAFAARLGQFKAGNSPLLAAHTHRTPDGSPSQIGWVIEIAVTRAAVPVTLRFAMTDLAEQWWLLASDPAGRGIAISIGFMPVRWVYGAAADIARKYGELREALAGVADDEQIRVYTEIELLEISAVPVPANREALQALAAKAAADGQAQTVIAEFARDLAAEVVAAIRRVGGDEAQVKAMQDAIAAAVKDAKIELQALLVDQLDEIKALLPDDVNGSLPEPLPLGPEDGDDDAAADDGAPEMKAACADLRLAADGNKTEPKG